jgi:membrane-associated phospholipid phosphatase
MHPALPIRSLQDKTPWYDRSYLLMPLGFTVVLTVYFLYLGSLLYSTPTLFFLLGVPIVGVAGFYRRSARGWGALLMIVLSYEALAGPIDALADKGRVLSLSYIDKSLWGFNLTGWVQTSLASATMTFVTVMLYEMLIPMVAATSFLVWRYDRPDFGKYITAMVLTSYAALVTFMLLPTSPPWFSGVASNLLQSSGLASVPSFLSPLAQLFEPDKFAAFPSLHAAYTVICSYFLLKTNRKPGAFAVLVTGGTFFSTMYLGQHYLIDLLAGTVYAILPCLISERWQIVDVLASIPRKVR